jgi:hypothetical protein
MPAVVGRRHRHRQILHRRSHFITVLIILTNFLIIFVAFDPSFRRFA